MTLTQQWRYLNLIRNSFYIKFPAKGVMSYWQIISSRLYVFQNELVHSLAEHFQTSVKKVTNANVFLKIHKKHCRPHRMP